MMNDGWLEENAKVFVHLANFASHGFGAYFSKVKFAIHARYATNKAIGLGLFQAIDAFQSIHE